MTNDDRIGGPISAEAWRKAMEEHRQRAEESLEPLALLLEPGGELNDFILHPSYESAWVTVDGLSVCIRRRDGGVRIEVYPQCAEDEDELGSLEVRQP